MFSCLCQIWEWMDPNRLDKASKQLHQNNTANSIVNMEQPNEIKIPQQVHQHNAPLHYCPMVHQHHQIYNKQQHQHSVQSPLLFSISPGSQMGYSNTPHRHFQHYPQLPQQSVQNESIYSAHHHQPRKPPIMNQVAQESSVYPTPPQPPQTLDLQQRNQVNQVVQPEVQKDVQQKTSPPKPKTKESEKIQLRSPSAKRPENSPVTMQGWLYKQGSEGLMLWKKRWFVLSEFCLFYYKTSTEDKMLGSILLPSYKVSVCDTEDKVNRKHAFKCEHVNMRTYVLAADSHELMMRWIHVLSLACSMQTTTNTETKRPKTPNEMNNEQHKANVPAGQTMVYNNGPISTSSRSVMHTHTPSNITDFSNSSQQELSQYNQPLYANAPPKPRRLADGFCSPGPEVLERCYSPHPPQSVMSHNTKSPSFIFEKHSQASQPLKPDRLVVYKDHQQQPQGLSGQNVDRRTPDTYGRSKTVKSPRNPSDYEDIYNKQEMYKRPLSPGEIEIRSMKGYPNVTNFNYKLYSSVNFRPKEFVPYDGRNPIIAAVPRPHSADFLENRLQEDPDQMNTHVTQPMRPKSSLDINMHTKNECSMYDKFYKDNLRPNILQTQNIAANDNYFYSQERYAEKMRKSIQYLQKMPLQYNTHESGNRKPSSRRNMESPINHDNPSSFAISNYQQQPLRSRSALSDGSFMCAQDLENESFKTDYPTHLDPNMTYNTRTLGQDQFIRSASARFAQAVNQDASGSKGNFRQDGERKREESMKRLLEWKQRMLQSPLNRKAQGYRSNFGKESNNPYMNSFINDKKVKKINTNSRKPASMQTLQYNSYSSDDEASGSISINTKEAAAFGRGTFPKSGSTKKEWNSNLENTPTHSVADLNQFSKYGYHNQHDEVLRRSLNDLSAQNKVNLSAGELLGRTHEELVLLLIQLRRQQSQTFQAIESCYNEIDAMQMQMQNMDQIKRIENLQKLDRIKQNLIDLENQYEKSKPLVNLVDNMVKLGSLYRLPRERNGTPDDMSHLIRERINFNQQVQEKRLIEEEKREWDRMEPSPFQLQEKVKQLYQLDGLIQEESKNLHNLQKDKEDIERTLGGLRNKLLKGYNNPAEMEQARRQQIILEKELSRVHFMLAQNSKKLEETVAGNARLEQELLILKQKLQLSRYQRNSPHQLSNPSEPRESFPYVPDTNFTINPDMDRVQKKIDDLQKQREELRLQVRQLTDRSNNPQQSLKQSIMADALNSKKKSMSSWRETDLDTMNNIDYGYGEYHDTHRPLYINTNIRNLDSSDHLHNAKTSDSTSEDNIYTSEKPEIKTVRIVKRESERRQRDREKISTGKCDSLIEEDDFHPPPPPNFYYERGFCNSLPERSQTHKQKSSELSPVFKSEAARQIITEMGKKPAQGQRRTVPREKRRHFTAPHDNSTAAVFGNFEERRARDDLDIERALRQRIDAPDIVRSTLSSKELKYNEETIDSILSTPNKISIPERYIPEQSPQLSPEEQERRMKKVESIKKMLSDTAIMSTGVSSTCPPADENSSKSNSIAEKSRQSSYILEEKKQREHLLQLNQILAKQVMEISKVVAARNLEKLPLKQQAKTTDEEDCSSPVTPLPLYQQRENYYS